MLFFYKFGCFSKQLRQKATEKHTTVFSPYRLSSVRGTTMKKADDTHTNSISLLTNANTAPMPWKTFIYESEDR